MVTIAHNPRRPDVSINGYDRPITSVSHGFNSLTNKGIAFDGRIRMILRPPNKSDHGICLFEEAPSRKTLRFMHRYQTVEGRKTKILEYQVWMPWMLYVILVNGRLASPLYVFSLKHSLKHDTDQLYFPPIPNVYITQNPAGKVCTGEMSTHIERPNGRDIDWQGTCANVIADFWSANFNSDIMAFETVNPFNLIRGMADTDVENDPAFPTIHDGMMAWSKLAASQVTSLPFHYIETFETFIERIKGEYGYEDEGRANNAAASVFEKLSSVIR